MDETYGYGYTIIVIYVKEIRCRAVKNTIVKSKISLFICLFIYSLIPLFLLSYFYITQIKMVFLGFLTACSIDKQCFASPLFYILLSYVM